MLAFGVVILVFMAVAGTSLVSGSRLAEADKWNQHTYKVLSTADRMLQSMVNMETGARGYLVAGDEAFPRALDARPEGLPEGLGRGQGTDI